MKPIIKIERYEKYTTHHNQIKYSATTENPSEELCNCLGEREKGRGGRKGVGKKKAERERGRESVGREKGREREREEERKGRGEKGEREKWKEKEGGREGRSKGKQGVRKNEKMGS